MPSTVTPQAVGAIASVVVVELVVVVLVLVLVVVVVVVDGCVVVVVSHGPTESPWLPTWASTAGSPLTPTRDLFLQSF